MCDAGLINAADCKDWTQFAADPSKAADTASMSSESTDDVWCITDEQREYYIRQFRLMQDDLHGVISGNRDRSLVCCDSGMVRMLAYCITSHNKFGQVVMNTCQGSYRSWKSLESP